MPNIRPSADLRNHYNEISEFCRTTMEPVFITKNGHGDLVVMSMEAYERLCGRNELQRVLEEAYAETQNENYMDYEDFMKEFRKK